MARNGLSKICMHWPAGTYEVSALDMKHYHSITDGDGQQHMGNHLPEANAPKNIKAGRPYAAHVRRFNSGCIGMACSGMAGATEKNPGPYPIKADQLQAFASHVADMADNYAIPIDRHHVFMHSEVQPRFGVRQNGKWDINWLPGHGLKQSWEAGDIVRQMARNELLRMKLLEKTERERNSYPRVTRPWEQTEQIQEAENHGQPHLMPQEKPTLWQVFLNLFR